MKFILIFLLLLVSVANVSAQTWNIKGGSLSFDKQGVAWHPVAAVDSSNNIYVAFTQHTNPAQNNAGQWDYSSIYVKKWNGSSWSFLGSRIWSGNNTDNTKPEAFRPSIAVLGTTPYVSWYESGSYDGSCPANPNCPRVFVKHWDGNTWQTDFSSDGTSWLDNPFIAVINGLIHLNTGGLIKSLNTGNGQWTTVGSNTAPSGKLFAIGTDPYILSTTSIYHLVGNAWTVLGSTPNSQSYIHGSDVTVLGTTIYVTWAERTQTGNSKVYLSHWNGSAWISDGGVLNNTSTKDATYPSITNDGTNVWVSWAEGGVGEKPSLYSRSWDGSNLSAIYGPHNILNGSAGLSTMVSTTVPQVIWDEKNQTNNITRQIYVKGFGDSGASNTDNLSAYGNNGSTIYFGQNVWQYMNPGGIANGNNGSVGDEGYEGFRYDPVTKRAYVWGKYHANGGNGGGEDQNALLGYSYVNNRWDVIEIGESHASEYINSHGHDSGRAAVDTIHGTWMSAGSILGGYATYNYDLVAGRGKRMMPPVELYPDLGQSSDQVTAFNSDNGTFMVVGSGLTAIYNPATNSWTSQGSAPNFVSSVNPPIGLAYDTKNHLFVLYSGSQGGGTLPGQTFTWNPSSPGWVLKNTSINPTDYQYIAGISMAADNYGHVLMLASCDGRNVFAYDTTGNTWTKLSQVFPNYISNGICNNPQQAQPPGSYLTYDSDDGIFLFFQGGDLNRVYAFRYAPTGAVAGKWVSVNGPSNMWAEKHQRGSYGNGRLYFTAGDSPHSYSQQTWSVYMPTKLLNPSNDSITYVLEHGECSTAGNIQPKAPDYVGFPYDSTRNVFWFVPGEFVNYPYYGCAVSPGVAGANVISGGSGYHVGDAVNFNSCTTGTVATGYVAQVGSNGTIISGSGCVGACPVQMSNEGTNYTCTPSVTVSTSSGGSGASLTAIMNNGVESNSYGINPPTATTGGYLSSGSIYTFNPTNKLFSNPFNSQYSAGSWDAVYDAKTDQIYTRYNDGNGQNHWLIYNAKTGSVTKIDAGSEFGGTGPLLSPDFVNRKIYAIDGLASKVYSFDMDSPHNTTLLNSSVPLPPGVSPTQCYSMLIQPQTAWDPINNVLLYGANGCGSGSIFYAYHPNLNSWEQLPTVNVDSGNYVAFRTLVYDESIGGVVGFGWEDCPGGINDPNNNLCRNSRIMSVYQYAPFTPPSDVTPPTIVLLTPTTGHTYPTSNNIISVTGSASDNIGVDHVTWSNNRSGSGNAIGQTSWSVNNIVLQVGDNILTFRAYDVANNYGEFILTVTYTPVSLNLNTLSGQVNLNGNTRSN